MGSEWVDTTLGQVVKDGAGFIQTGPFGSQLHASDYINEGIPVIMPINLANNKISLEDIARISEDDAERLSRHIVQTGDIIYSRRGDVTRKALITEKETGMFCGTGCLLVRPGNEVDPKFLTYHLSSPRNQEWIVRHAIGATMPNLNTSILADVPLSLPPQKTQKAIAHILGSLDDKIELNRQINATLEAMAQALFKSWFVDFDPVIDNALVAGNPIPEPLQQRAEARKALGDQRKPLPANIQQQFPSRFVFNEEMGWVPEGWGVRPAQEVATISIGKTPPRKEQHWFTRAPEGNVIWVSIKDMGNVGVFIGRSSEYLTPEAIDKFNIKIAPAGSVILSFKLTLGRVAIAQNDITTNEAIAHFVAPKCGLNKEYIYCYLANFNFGNLGSTSSIATAVNSKLIKALPFLVPSEQASSAFKEISGCWLTRINTVSDQNFELSKLRDTLLPKLLSGQLRVSDAEQRVKEAL